MCVISNLSNNKKNMNLINIYFDIHRIFLIARDMIIFI